MTTTPNNLTQLASDALSSLPGDPGSAEWRKEFRAVLTRAHTAAYIVGVAERAGVKPSEGLFKGMSKAERADVRKAVEGQLAYADKFAGEVDGLSEAQVAARLQLYPGAARATLYGARYPGLTQVPGDGQTACLSNCKCFLTEQDGGIQWELSTTENCQDCIDMAAGSPYGTE